MRLTDSPARVRPLDARVRAAMFLRSFAVQGSWNYRTLVGAGLAFALLPALRAIYAGEPERLSEAVRRHSGVFNSHPYLSPLAIGAIAQLEAAGEDAAVVERFKSAIRGSLGTLGDRLVWAGWRPVCLLVALVLFAAGAAWWVAVGLFLVVYNAGHMALRVWSYRVGLHRGRSVGEELRRSSVPQTQRILMVLGAGLVGMLVPLVASGRLTGVQLDLPWVVAALLATVLGVRFGAAVQRPLILVLGGLAFLGLVLKFFV